MTNTRRTWTKREEEVLKKLWSSPQVSRQDLVDLFGRTWSGVAGKARNMELPTRVSIETQLNEELLLKLMKVVDG